MTESWRFQARDAVAFRAWQQWHALSNPKPTQPPQPKWLPLAETMPADAQRSSVKARVLQLAKAHGVVRAVMGRHEIAVFSRYIVDKMPRDNQSPL